MDIEGAELEALRGKTARATVLDEPFEAEIPEGVEPGEILSYPGAGLDRPGGGWGDLHLVLRVRGSAPD